MMVVKVFMVVNIKEFNAYICIYIHIKNSTFGKGDTEF